MHEINLLPPARRQSLRREVALLSVAHLLTSLNLGLLLITMIGFIVAVFLWGTGWATANSLAEQRDQRLAQYRTLRDEIAEHNAFISQIRTLTNSRLVWSDFLEQFLMVVPPGVEITTLSGNLKLDQTAFTEANLSISGQALARSTLIVFHSRLQALAGVLAVESPSSNLLRRDNPLYRFTLTLEPPK